MKPTVEQSPFCMHGLVKSSHGRKRPGRGGTDRSNPLEYLTGSSLEDDENRLRKEKAVKW